MSGAGQAAGDATASPVIEPQWPAVSTQLGAISVPVHRNDAPKVIRATEGYAPLAVAWPPTMAEAGAAPASRSAPATRAAHIVERRWVIWGANAARAGFWRSYWGDVLIWRVRARTIRTDRPRDSPTARRTRPAPRPRCRLHASDSHPARRAALPLAADHGRAGRPRAPPPPRQEAQEAPQAPGQEEGREEEEARKEAACQAAAGRRSARVDHRHAPQRSARRARPHAR